MSSSNSLMDLPIRPKTNKPPISISISTSTSTSTSTPSPAQQTAPASSKSLAALPSELIVKITHHLDVLSLTCLKLTNRSFNKLIARPKRSTLIQMQILLYDRKRPHFFYCKTCARLRPRLKFADNQLIALPHLISDSCCRRGIRLCDHSWRVCIDCGIGGSQPAYSIGSIIWVKGVRYVLCRSCRTFGKVVDRGGSGLGSEVCGDCSWS